MSERPLTDAVMAATMITPQIVGQCVLAEHAHHGRAQTHLRLDRAIELGRELVTRLETAKLAFAATPIEEP